MWFNPVAYSFEVVESWKDDLMSSSDQADCSQQLQHQCLCPDAMNVLRLVCVKQTKEQYFIHMLHYLFYFKKIC